MGIQCERILIISIKYLVHKLLGIVARVFVSFIKPLVLRKISVLKNFFQLVSKITQID